MKLLPLLLLLAAVQSCTEPQDTWTATTVSLRSQRQQCSDDGLDMPALSAWCGGVCQPLYGCDYVGCISACRDAATQTARDGCGSEWGFYYWSGKCPNHKLDAPRIPCQSLQCR